MRGAFALKNAMLFFPYNYCDNCKTNSIEIFSWHNYGQKYAKLLDEATLTGKFPELNHYAVYTMRCTRCGREYKIVWEDGVPKPIYDNFDIDIFMERFKDNSIHGRPKICMNIYKKKLDEIGENK